MKTFIYLFILFGFTTCKSVHTEVSNHPFAINGASYNYWTGGRPGVSGIKVILNYTSDQKVTFDKIYFQKKMRQFFPSNHGWEKKPILKVKLKKIFYQAKCGNNYPQIYMYFCIK